MSSSSSAEDSPSTPQETDARWFTNEVQPHEGALRSFLHKRFPTLSDRDDLVQESYARLVRARRGGPIENVRAFLFTTARNLACDIFRRSRVVKMEPLVNAEPSTVLEDKPSVEDVLNSTQELEILHQAIASLPPRCREVMILQKIQGLSNGEIAKRLSISINTVNAQMVIGLMRCREYLRAHGILRGRRP